MILSMLGLATACGKSELGGGGGSLVCEYGTPYVTFSVKGKVTDTDGAPVPGIRVAVSEYPHDPATQTDSEGIFVFYKTPFYMGDIGKLYFTDVDGEANGEFEPLTLDVAFEKSGSKPDGNWHTGYYTAPDVEVRLTRAGEKQEE